MTTVGTRVTACCLSALLGAAAISAQGGRPAFDGARAFADLERIVAIGPRPAGSAALARTRDYITRQLAAAGVTPVPQAFDADTPRGRVRMVNLRATFPGTRAERIIVAGHYDTKIFDTFRFVGANDGGSSTAFLLEFARVLKAQGPRPFTIELVFFDGEEAVVEWGGTDRTYGSRHYVEAARRAGDLRAIKALILVDMIGDRDLALIRESQSTPWLTSLVWASARTLGFHRHFPDWSMPIEDDHLPFLEAGIPAVDLIDFDYPAWHTADDTIERVSGDSLAIVGTVLLDALPAIERRLAAVSR